MLNIGDYDFCCLPLTVCMNCCFLHLVVFNCEKTSRKLLLFLMTRTLNLNLVNYCDVCVVHILVDHHNVE